MSPETANHGFSLRVVATSMEAIHIDTDGASAT